jgi:hypothetical protein
MIVDQQDCGSRVPDRWSKNFAWMHEAGIQGSNGDLMGR